MKVSGWKTRWKKPEAASGTGPGGLSGLKGLTALVLAMVATGASGGCVIQGAGPRGDPYGDIAFDWSFAGETSCARAGVDELDIVILQGNVVVDEIIGEHCIGRGLILTGYLAGTYDVFVDAYDRADRLLYTADFTAHVQGGIANDVGLVRFDPVQRPVPVTMGDLGFFWAFAYPTDTPILDCAIAGVTEVDVILQRLDGSMADIVETRACTASGLVFSRLPVGEYALILDAYGRDGGADLLLYTRELVVRVRENREVDLGDVVLARVESSFGDLELDWELAGGCAANGVSEVTVSIRRTNLREAEDMFTAPCSAVTVFRPTFVPGTYTVRVEANGASGLWRGQQSVDLPPNHVGSVTVALAPR